MLPLFFFPCWFSLNPSSSLLSMVEPKNPSLNQHSGRVETAFLRCHSWVGVVGVLGWGWDQRGWASGVVVIGEAGVGFGCGFVVGLDWGDWFLFWVLIWFWDCVLVLQCKGGRWKESKAAAVEEDDDRLGSGVHGNEEVELEVELQKKNVWFVFVCVGVCHKVEEEMDLFFIFYYFGGWGLRLWSVVVGAVVVALGSGGSGCWQWQWVCW